MKKTHDLHDFMNQISAEMASEYTRIQKRVSEDPGTAGDQGEENWAEILRDWLPQEYHIVTKGRIISQDGETSPQIDILILHASYPSKLLNKKLFLAAGVAAAFECKTTLKASHITEVIENSIKIKNLYKPRGGTPYRELHSPIIYGLLAHSHSWKGEQSEPEKIIINKLISEDRKLISHPRYALDLLCVADLGAWQFSKMAFVKSSIPPSEGQKHSVSIHQDALTINTAYLGHILNDERQDGHFRPMGFLISQLNQILAWENISMRNLAEYYFLTNLTGNGSGSMRSWSGDIFTDNVRIQLQQGGMTSNTSWSEWSPVFL
ncbi:DUF6602 domain-containing protein [Symbiopectobacterium purcellii]|uniref:DUF6602 domain-containing protein n=1 Tax=Symbiopectobacterium purcellii TaxID=2871826 RepID=A0ABX9AGQ6_9ENTR|nr:DUF6602 domain-containing protein [Symbiopectobacterium purcellii]QZN94342.1 hypothetical protein K6K13_13370 [Symbiopectobacterium purcellii]